MSDVVDQIDAAAACRTNAHKSDAVPASYETKGAVNLDVFAGSVVADTGWNGEPNYVRMDRASRLQMRQKLPN